MNKRLRSQEQEERMISRDPSLVHIPHSLEEFVLDQNGFITNSNLETVNVTGYDEFEVLGKHLSIFYRPEDSEKAKEDLDKAARLGYTLVLGPMVKKRGASFWAKMKIRLVTTTNSDSPTFQVLLQDTTHRTISKERLRTLRDEYLSIFNNPFVGTFKFRIEDGRIQMCNQKILDILGKQNSNNLFIESFFSSFQQFELFMTSIKSKRRLEDFKFLIRNETCQEEQWATVSARYFENQGFVEGVLLDISQQHSQMQELIRVNTELDNFIYHASHDLRSPLTSIMGLLDLGMKETSPEVIQSYLKMMQGRIEHMDGLLKDLISISYNSGKEKEYEVFHFEDEVNKIVRLLKNPDHTLNVTVDVDQPMTFRTDPVRIRTILRNLISNAFKYRNPAATPSFINIHIRVDSSHAAIQIKDNGIGIAPEFKAKVYEMFFRATEKSSGSGLGLYIVKSMVEKLKGKISFESTLGVGTTFLLTIPNQASENF